MVTELSLWMEDRRAARCATVDQLRPAQYTKEMAFQDMGKIPAGRAQTILILLCIFAGHEIPLRGAELQISDTGAGATGSQRRAERREEPSRDGGKQQVGYLPKGDLFCLSIGFSETFRVSASDRVGLTHAFIADSDMLTIRRFNSSGAFANPYRLPQ